MFNSECKENKGLRQLVAEVLENAVINKKLCYCVWTELFTLASHTTPDKLGYESQKWVLLFAYLNIQVFHISSTYPKLVLHGLNPRKNLFIVGGVGDVDKHYYYKIQEFIN